MKDFGKNNFGATAIEYALLAALIGTVIIVALQFVGGKMSTTYSKVGSAVSGASGL